MNILNYGAGAVGLGIDSFILNAGYSVDILSRESTCKALKNNGLKRHGIFGNINIASNSFNCFSNLDQITNKTYDYILISIKSFNTEFAAKDILKNKHLTDENTKIILFQNGWGNAEIFANYFDKKQIFNARVITGYTRPQINIVEITVHADDIRIGSLFHNKTEQLDEICKIIRTGGMPCQTDQNISKHLWAKMLYNCALNPLGAIVDSSYGQLAKNDYAKEIMDNIIKEVFEVMKGSGYSTFYNSSDDYTKIFYEKLVPLTSNHKSSMLQDIKAKKRTEIDALNGEIIKLASNLNITVDYNKNVYNIIKFIEERNLNN